MRTMKEAVMQEILRTMKPPPKDATARQVKAHIRLCELATERVIRAIEHWVDFDGGEGNGHG